MSLPSFSLARMLYNPLRLGRSILRVSMVSVGRPVALRASSSPFWTNSQSLLAVSPLRRRVSGSASLMSSASERSCSASFSLAASSRAFLAASSSGGVSVFSSLAGAGVGAVSWATAVLGYELRATATAIDS